MAVALPKKTDAQVRRVVGTLYDMCMDCAASARRWDPFRAVVIYDLSQQRGAVYSPTLGRSILDKR